MTKPNTKHYELHIRVTARLLTPVTELIEGDPDADIVKMEMVDAEPQPAEDVVINGRMPHRRKRQYVGHKQIKEMSSVKCLLLAVQTHQPAEYHCLKGVFMTYDFSPSTVSPALSHARKEGWITEDDQDRVSITEAGIRALMELPR